MKVQALHIQNTMRIKVADIERPDGHMVVLTGKNAQGKSSALKSLFWAIGGPKAVQIDQVVREGADKAVVNVELDDYVVTRSQTAGGTMTLKVETKDGKSFKSPQALLDSILSKSSIDPVAFIGLSAKDQVAKLLEIVKLSINPQEIDAKIKSIYEERTAIGRVVKQLEGQLAGMAEVADDVPNEPVSASALLAELEAANSEISANGIKRDNLESYQQLIGQKKEEIKTLQDEVARFEAWIEANESEINALVDPDIDTIKAKLADIDGINAKVRSKQDYVEVSDKLATQRDLAAACTTNINDFEAQKRAALADAKFPVNGLGFGDGCVTYNDIPLSQASSAEQIRVSMAIAMATNPDLKVIHIAAGSLLDSEGMNIIKELAEEGDYQVWIEKVDESGKVGIVFEDGEIVAVNDDVDEAVDMSDF